MPLDGLTMNVLVRELDPMLRNGRVLKVYQPDETTITLQLRLPGKTEILLLSADALYPRMHTLPEQPKNPLNPPAFCMLLRKYLEPSRLLSIEQQGLDRIVYLRFEAISPAGQSVELALVLELMGRNSNLYLLNDEGVILDALKRFPEKGIMPGCLYSPPPDQGKVHPGSLSSEEFVDEIRLLPAPTPLWKAIADRFQGFSKVAAKEVIARAGFHPDVERHAVGEDSWQLVHQGLTSLMQELNEGGTPTYYTDEPHDFTAYTLTGRSGQIYPSANELMQTILTQKHEGKRLDELKGRLRRQLANHYKRVVKKEALQQATLQEAEQADIHRQQGELLTASFHLIPLGADMVEVPDYMKEGAPLVRIPLDPRLSPSSNVQRVFKRYTKAKASHKHASLQLKKTQAERRYLDSILLQIELADSEAILREIELELTNEGYLKRKPSSASKKSQTSAGPARYVSSDGITILVGRNNQQNDQLTFRMTQPNHLWLHARNIPGSHVAILHEGDVPPETLLQAASLAAYFSQSRKSPKVPVDYTLRKHVRKPKGASPGFVNYDGAKTILVNPTDFSMPKQQL